MNTLLVLLLLTGSVAALAMDVGPVENGHEYSYLSVDGFGSSLTTHRFVNDFAGDKKKKKKKEEWTAHINYICFPMMIRFN